MPRLGAPGSKNKKKRPEAKEMDQTGIEPAASEVQAQHSTNELQARVLVSPTKIRSFDLITCGWLEIV